MLSYVPEGSSQDEGRMCIGIGKTSHALRTHICKPLTSTVRRRSTRVACSESPKRTYAPTSETTSPMENPKVDQLVTRRKASQNAAAKYLTRCLRRTERCRSVELRFVLNDYSVRHRMSLSTKMSNRPTRLSSRICS